MRFPFISYTAPEDTLNTNIPAIKQVSNFNYRNFDILDIFLDILATLPIAHFTKLEHSSNTGELYKNYILYYGSAVYEPNQ